MEKAGLVDKENHTIRSSGAFIISGLSGGHGVFHWYYHSFLLMLPEVQVAFKLSQVGVAAITSTREIASGAVNLPGGILADAARRHWGLILSMCMGVFGIGSLLMGFSPMFPLLLAGMVIVAIATSIWHLPAASFLSHRFPKRRGTVLSLHGVGGNVGDVLGPIVTGFLLAFLSWRSILSLYATAPLILSFIVFWAFKDIGQTAEAGSPSPGLQRQIDLTKRLVKNPVLWGITFIAGLRGMAFVAFMTYFPIYLSSDLGMTSQQRGLHFGLLVLAGIVSTPIMGYLSDRFGRKQILVPGLMMLGVFMALLSAFGEGIVLVVLISLIGLFLYGDQPILTATALDIVGKNVANTTLGTISLSRYVMASASPFIAGGLYETRGAEATFLYVAAVFAVASLALLLLPLKPASH